MSEPVQPRSILVVAGFAPSLIMFRGSLLAAMRSFGHHVTAAAPHLVENRAVAQQLRAMGVVCRDIPLMRTGLNPMADISLLVALIRLMRAERPQVVFGYTIKAVVFGLIAASIAGVQRRYALITGLGYAFTGEIRGKRRLVQCIARRMYATALKQADVVFFQNRDDDALFRKLGLITSRMPSVITNGSGVDIVSFAGTPVPPAPLRFLLIARLLTAKGIREYAAAAAAIRAKHFQVQFDLVGGIDSNPDAVAESEVQQWHDCGILTWHGEVADVRPYIAACHVYVLPSYREGTPRSVLEAMAMGRPIITTDAPGCRETVVHGHNGLLVPPRSVEPLARAMERFVTEPELIEVMGRRSRMLAESKYDVRQVNAIMLREMKLL